MKAISQNIQPTRSRETVLAKDFLADRWSHTIVVTVPVAYPPFLVFKHLVFKTFFGYINIEMFECLCPRLK